jgi:hypothetical protein
MTAFRTTILGISFLGLASSLAAEPPSYAKQVKPFLARYCLECHTGDRAKGGLDLASFKGLLEGGNNGPVVAAGKPDESRLVLLAEGKDKPVMPPVKARQPKTGEAAVLRAWVAAGAKDDSREVAAALPDVKPRSSLPAPVTGLAVRADGKVLAAGRYREVLLLDPATGDELAKIAGQKGPVTALAFSPSGSQLAVASGLPGTSGEVRVYDIPPAMASTPRQVLVLEAHHDVIQDLAFAPDGQTLATASYDRLVKLWDVRQGKHLRTLKDHSDSVYGVAFSPDGRLLASAAADRAVKVWDVAGGRRLYTLGEATDWVYAVAWSPDGRHLAAGGVDRSLRVWQVTADSGRLVHSVFAHEGPVTRLAYAADGKTLYSLGEDRTVKVWDALRMVEQRVLPRQPEAVLSLTLLPSGGRLALGRYDGTALLLDAGSGKVQTQLLPVKPKPPVLTRVFPPAVRRGGQVKLTLEGRHLDPVTEVVSTVPGLIAKVTPDQRGPTSVRVDLTVPSATAAGVYQIALKGPEGQTGQVPFVVDLFPEVEEREGNHAPSSGQSVSLSASIRGSLERPGDVDHYQFQAAASEEVGVQVFALPGAQLDPVLIVSDLTGGVLAEGKDGLLAFTAPRDGTYALGIHDREFRGGPATRYHAQVGRVPVVTGVFPLGVARGTEREVRLTGVNLPGRTVRVAVPAKAVPGTEQPINAGGATGKAAVTVGEFPEVTQANGGELPVPGTANGLLATPGREDDWRITARKGQRLVVEVHARRLGSPVDSVVEVRDAAGRPVRRATLRCLARTYVTFRDHDSFLNQIRMENWAEFAVNDYVYAGTELLRINELPTHPDSDCFFFAVAKQRIGYLDTTPTHLPLGTPMYKVVLHPPGATFPPNGFPVIRLDYQNDDGGPGFGKDSRLFFDVPADGDYFVRVRDARGFGGPDHAYRLTVRPPRPDFKVNFTPTAPSVGRGAAVPIAVTADRIDGFDGPIELRLEGLLTGLSAPATTIPAGETTTAFALFAEPKADVPAKGTPIKLIAQAVIDGREIVHEAAGGVPKVADPGDILTVTEQCDVTLKPGGEVKLTVRIERRNGFKGRVPVEVRGLPHGVRVLDIGLNGILITERETVRTMAIYAEPWVEPTRHPIVVLAKREGKNTEHAAKSVLLKIEK